MIMSSVKVPNDFYHLTHLYSSQQGGERRIMDSLTWVRGYRVKWLEGRRVTLHIHQH